MAHSPSFDGAIRMLEARIQGLTERFENIEAKLPDHVSQQAFELQHADSAVQSSDAQEDVLVPRCIDEGCKVDDLRAEAGQFHGDSEARLAARVLALQFAAPWQKSCFDVVRTIPVDLAGVPRCARPHRHLVGVRGSNVFDIQDSIGHVEVRGQEAGGGLEFVISACDPESADKGFQVC